MQSRRKVLIISVAVALSLLFLGAVALVVRGFLQFSEVETSLQGSKESLESLYVRNPFPSSENLKLERENLQTIKQELMDLQSAMGAEQIEPAEQSPAKFITQFWETQKSLLAKAGGVIKVDKNFDFGFGRHMKGDLPAQQDIKRLTQQLKIVEALCNVLYTCKISALGGIARQEFESGTTAIATPKPRVGNSADISLKNIVDPLAGVIPEGKLYGRWHFALSFSGREAAVMNVLNNLANSSLFVVVTSLDIKGDEKLFDHKEVDAAPGKTTEEAVPAKDAPKPRDYRVVCGRDAVLNVKLELDVYQFAKPQTAEPAKKPGGVK